MPKNGWLLKLGLLLGRSLYQEDGLAQGLVFSVGLWANQDFGIIINQRGYGFDKL